MHEPTAPPRAGPSPAGVTLKLGSGADITQLTRRFSRRVLVRPNLVYFLWRFAANGIRTGRALTSPRLFSDTPAIGRELAEQGIVVGASEAFLTEDGQRALREAAAGILETSRSKRVEAEIMRAASHPGQKKDFLIHLVSPEGMAPDDPLLKLALDRKLLEIVAAYLGLWPCLHSIGAWLNHPTDAPPKLSQLWHSDPEDMKLVKAFIYLTDVDERCGPFSYVPGTHPFGSGTGAARTLKQRVPDDLMTRVFPSESWRVCTGPAHTMILADTVGFHRGGKPIEGRRILITLTYTSGAPMTHRTLWVRGTPTWASSAIQRAAFGSLEGAPPPRPKKKAGKTGFS